MVSDDERRLVAARLRMSDERDAAGFVDCLLAEVVRGREFCETPCEECHTRLLGELADLIEPSDHIGDSDKMVDRDALLELAKELSGDVLAVPAVYGTYQSGYVAACQDIARRIREACGEVSE